MAVTWTFRCLLWGIVSASFTAYVIRAHLMGESIWVSRTIAGIVTVLGALSTVVAFHISTLRCSETHTFKTLLQAYILTQALGVYAPFCKSEITRISKNPRKEQEAFLRRLIARDVKTEYGRRYLRGIETLQDYRQKHPLTKYDHYEDYFKRLADGEKNVCVACDLDRFGISSGTTGKGKLIPFVIPKNGGRLLLTVPKILSKSNCLIQKAALLYCKPAELYTKSGLPITPAAFISQSSLSKTMCSVTQNTPFSAFQISDDFEATYVHLLFALTDKNLFVFMAPFASQIYRAFVMLEDDQEMLLSDLAEGRINPKLKINEEIRRSLNEAMTPNLARANELRREFAGGFVGIVGRIWPHLECIAAVDISGYWKKLSARYTKGIKLYAVGYGCTEATTIAINLWMDGSRQQYMIIPNAVMVEFIPEDQSFEDNPETLFIDEVEVGKRYEIVLTTESGFYRYRMGDVIEVVNFHENCPVIQVKYRTGELLNLRSEKIDKLVVDNAVEESIAGWPKATLVEWTCAESPLMYEGTDVVQYDMFYLLFVELETRSITRLSADQRSLFDKSLRKQHEFYDHYRHVGTICEARVFLVRPGSFQKLQDFIIANSSASYNQFKMHKKLRTKATLNLMMENVVDGDIRV